MTTDYRAELQRLVKAYDDHALSMIEHDVEAFHLAAERARAFLAQPEPEGPTVMEIIELADEIEAEELGQVDLVRRALARWGRPAVEPEPEGPTEWGLLDLGNDVMGNPLPCDPDLLLAFARAAIAADRARWGRPAVEPVPVSKRLPGEGDCDSEGRCWLASVDVEPGWVTDNPEQCTNWTHWLPHYALPVPTTTSETP